MNTKTVAKNDNLNKGENNGMFGKKHSDEAKERMRQRALLREKPSKEANKKQSEIMKSMNMKRERKNCPHCDKSVAVNMYAAWHGDKCKFKTQ